MKYTLLGLTVAAVWYAAAPSGHHVRSLAESGKAGTTQSDRWTWHGRVASGKTVSIHGVNGDVSAEPASGSEVEVTASKHARRSDPDDVRIQVVEHDGGVTICAIYPTRRNRENSCAADGAHNNDVRTNDVTVDFVVRVPRGVNFEGATVNGGVDAVGLDGDVDVTTVNGNARLETNGGEAHAGTVNGSVTAVVRALGSRGLNFETVNGGITVSLPAGLSADLDAETVNGSITSDFPISVQGRMNPRHLFGRIGQGGRTLKLETVNGSVRIRQLP